MAASLASPSMTFRGAGERGRELSPELDACVAWLKRAARVPGVAPGAWGEEHDTTAAEFLTSPDVRKLVAYAGAGGELVLLTPYAALPVAPAAFMYFVKRDAPAGGAGGAGGGGAFAPLTLAGLRASLQMGFVNGGGVDSLLRLLSDVFLPGVRDAAGPTAAWPESLRKDFTGQSQR